MKIDQKVKYHKQVKYGILVLSLLEYIQVSGFQNIFFGTYKGLQLSFDLKGVL